MFKKKNEYVLSALFYQSSAIGFSELEIRHLYLKEWQSQARYGLKVPKPVYH